MNDFSSRQRVAIMTTPYDLVCCSLNVKAPACKEPFHLEIQFFLIYDLITMLKLVFFILSLFFTLAVLGCSTKPLKSEKAFQQAFNRGYFQNQGRMEVPIPYGRVDILTHDFAIEVDELDKFHEGIGQALHYAYATGKHPGLALFVVQSSHPNSDKLDYIRQLCGQFGIKVWYINDELEKRSRR